MLKTLVVAEMSMDYLKFLQHFINMDDNDSEEHDAKILRMLLLEYPIIT